jgi:C4-dicarboxylate-specific signal transduction histidine kinase
MAAKRRRGVILKLTLLVAGLVIFAVSVTGALSSFRQEAFILARTRTESLALAQTTASTLINAVVHRDYAFVVDHGMLLARSREDLLYVVVLKKDGESLIHTPDGWRAEALKDPMSARVAAEKGQLFERHRSPIVGQEVFEATAPISLGGIKWGAVRLGFSTAPLEQAIAAMYRDAALTGSGFLFAALLGAFLLTRVIVRPISRLTAAARHIAAGDLQQTVPITSHDEIGELAESFNQMASHLQQAVAAMEAKSSQLERAYEELNAAHGELKATQGQLIQAGKLAALGELGAGIAHELNQPITSIRGFVQLMQAEVAAALPSRVETMERLLKDTTRMARIVDNVRTFARQQIYSPKPIEASAPLDDAMELISEQLRLHSITVGTMVEEGLPKVLGDRVQLQQVFLNLLSNARDALDGAEADREKEIVIRVSARGDRVSYAVTDTGPGVPPEFAERIFEPFFTTKPPGEGMGLGLSLSYGIVKEHRGAIEYSRSADGGACFRVEIPVAQDEPEIESGKDG